MQTGSTSAQAPHRVAHDLLFTVLIMLRVSGMLPAEGMTKPEVASRSHTRRANPAQARVLREQGAAAAKRLGLIHEACLRRRRLDVAHTRQQPRHQPQGARQRSGAADYASLKILGRLPGATTATGELHVPAPVDHVTWTDQVAGFGQRDDLGTAPKVLIHTGRMSQAASAGLMAPAGRPSASPIRRAENRAPHEL